MKRTLTAVALTLGLAVPAHADSHAEFTAEFAEAFSGVAGAYEAVERSGMTNGTFVAINAMMHAEAESQRTLLNFVSDGLGRAVTTLDADAPEILGSITDAVLEWQACASIQCRVEATAEASDRLDAYVAHLRASEGS